MSPKHDHGSESVHGKERLSQTNIAAERRDETVMDDWEEWEDDDVVTLIDVRASTKLSSIDDDLLDTDTSNSPIDSCHHSLIDPNIHPGLLAPPSSPISLHPRNTKHVSARAPRHSMGRISRFRSRKRQKAQHARLGIRLITDMAKFRRQNHVAHQVGPPAAPAPKFVDAAALRALEGSPTPDSVGSWKWLNKGKGRTQEPASPQQDARSPDQGLSPEDRPIVIGITLPSEEVASRGIDPQTATVNTIHTPVGPQNKQMVPSRPFADQSNYFSDANQPKSVWSPDTPDTVRSFNAVRPTSSVYSQATTYGTGLGVSNTEIPPVPALPVSYKKTPQRRLISLELGSRNADDDETGTPCTLFEEDGTTTPKKSPRGKLSVITPDSAGSRSHGWWDHVVTPFLDKRMSFASRSQKMESSIEEKNSGSGRDSEHKGKEFLFSLKEKTEHQSSKAIAIKTEGEHLPAPTEKMKPQASTLKVEDKCGLLDFSTLEKEQRPLSSLNAVDFSERNGTKQLVTAHAKEGHPPCLPTGTAGINDGDILITLATDERVKQPAKGIDIKQVLKYLSKQDQRLWKHTEEALSSSKSATAKENSGCMSSSNEGQRLKPREPGVHSECQDMPSPKPSWQQVQPPMAGVSTPPRQQTPHSNVSTSDVSRATLERSILSINEPNTREQQQPFVVLDRVQMNSTPILRIPTPRRTPPPRANATETEAPNESLSRGGPYLDQSGRREKPRMTVADDMPGDYPPPYSPPKKQVGAPVRYQAVFPPDHHLHKTFDSPHRTTSPGLAWTMSSQGGSRKMDDVASSQASTPSPRAACQIKQTARLLKESNGNRGPTSNQTGTMFLSVEDIQEAPSVTQPRRVHDLEGQVRAAPPLSSTRVHVPEQQSRFSISPTSSTESCMPHGDAQAGKHPISSRSVRLHIAQRRGSAHVSSAQGSGPLNWSGGVAVPEGGYGYTEPLPTRPAGTYLPQEHAHAAPGCTHRVERQRRRHEKEEVVARRIGGFWRGRGCMPEKGCFGRAGPEGRKKRRIWTGVVAALIALIVLAVVLAVVLPKHHGTHDAHSIWVNLTDFPPMPTGVLTVVGPDNTVANSGCTEPSTLWSCSLPKDDQDSVAPYKPNQPTVIFQIQWDNSTSKSWNVPNGNPPIPVSQKRDAIDGFSPNPSPPAFQEVWFMGETTDIIESNEKAGESAPFFISILESVNDTVSFPSLSRRQESDTGNSSITNILPAPDLEADGTPTPAVMLPNPVQQPVRLYDRGLATEHYGFYTYFKRTIFLKSVTVLNQTDEENVPLDEDGGCSKTEANYLVTWAQTRMLVQVWTRKLNNQNNTSLLTPGGSGGIDNSTELIRPGTMPYPVTVRLDTHGGDPNEKVVWEWPMDNRQLLNLTGAELLANNMAAGGTWINHRGSGNASYGGFDGGTGGCKCEWVNWV